MMLPITRLMPPPPPPAIIARERLFALLDPPALPLLTVIAAPAGYGKTTLVASWLAERQPEAAWLTLDQADDSLLAFWAAIAAALHARLDLPFDGVSPLAAHADIAPELRRAALVNELAALRAPATLVIDDYQVINNPEIHEELARLIERLPPTLHLVLVSRGIPPLPLARLRARGRLRELNALDLRFTGEEALAFLTAAVGRELTADITAALAERAGGWPAGLHLAALALRAQTPDTASVRNLPAPELLAAGDPFIFAYLAEEVVAAQPAALQEFLLRTSILDAFCVDLCAALLHVAPEAALEYSAAALLHEAERAQLFLTPLGTERRWFRYHPLFAEALRGQLQRRIPDRIQPLHRCAASWFANHDELTSAVRHTLAAGDVVDAAELLEQAGGRMLATGQALAWLGLVTGVPDAVLLARPQLLVFNAWALTLTGAAERAERYLQIVERGLPRLDAAIRIEIRCQMSMIRAQRAALIGDAETAIRLSREAIAHAPPEGELRVALAYILGSILHMCGRSGEAARLLDDAAPALVELSDPSLRVSAVLALGEALERHGSLRRAAAVYQDVLARMGANVPIMRIGARLGLSRIAISRCRYGEARDTATLALHEAEQASLNDLALQARLVLLTSAVAQGNRPEPADWMDFDKRIAAVTLPMLHTYLAAGRALLATSMRDIRTARRWLRQLNASQHHSPIERDMVDLAEATLRLATGDAASPIIERLERLSAEALASERGRTLVEALTLLALAYQRNGQGDLARQRLRQALELAAPEGLIQPFIANGLELQSLFVRVLTCLGNDSVMQRFVSQLLQQLPSAPVRAADSLIEPLNPREIEVLRLAAAGQSNRAIAEALYIAEGTVKKHLSNIYGKLGVASRIQALARAREHGLLDADRE